MHVSHKGTDGQNRTKRALRALVAVLMLSTLLAVVQPGVAAAGTYTPSGFDWPSGWQDPTSGAANRWRDYGFLTCGPANGDYGISDNSWYFLGSGHLGVDSSDAAGGSRIRPVASGTIRYAGEPWGAQWGGVLVVEHQTSTNERFAAVYGHLDPTTMRRSGSVTTSTTLGTILRGQPYGDHLHFGIVPLRSGQSAAGIAVRGSTSCAYGADGPSYGYTHPMRYLSGRRPAGSTTPTTPTSPCAYLGKIVGVQGVAAKYLVRSADGTCKRFHIPTGGDYQSIVANIGASNVVTFRTYAELTRIPNASQQARTARQDDPRITGPSQWLTRVTGLGSAAYGGDMVWTTSAAGRPSATNIGYWDMTVVSPGVYRVNCFIPNRSEAMAGVRYRVYDNRTHRGTVSLDQSRAIGWTRVGDFTVTSGAVRIQLRDNEGSGPYNARFAFDACEAVPIR